MVRQPIGNLEGKAYNRNGTVRYNVKHKEFLPQLNATEYKWYISLISVFKRQCEAFNVSFFLIGGSLEGVFKYHGFIPWDDDFDVRVNSSQKSGLIQALQSVPNHTLVWDKYMAFNAWKFYHNWNSIKTRRKWRWPYVDVFFFSQNNGHISVGRNVKSVVPTNDVLPLDYKPFEGMMMPVPRNMLSYLERTGGRSIELCRSLSYSHKTEFEERPAVTINCTDLLHIYPTVQSSIK